MGVLKIKTGIDDSGKSIWETIDNLNLTKVQADELLLKKSDNSYDNVNHVIENAAVDVYIECSDGGSPEEVNEWFNEEFPLKDEDGNENKARIKAIKGFLIEHRKVDNITYHLPYYWQVSEDAEGKDTSAWVLLNAIWG